MINRKAAARVLRSEASVRERRDLLVLFFVKFSFHIGPELFEYIGESIGGTGDQELLRIIAGGAGIGRVGVTDGDGQRVTTPLGNVEGFVAAVRAIDKDLRHSIPGAGLFGAFSQAEI